MEFELTSGTYATVMMRELMENVPQKRVASHVHFTSDDDIDMEPSPPQGSQTDEKGCHAHQSVKRRCNQK